MIICTIYDNEAKSYSPPQTFEHVTALSRTFQSFYRSSCPPSVPLADYHNYPEQFTCIRIAEFDPVSGKLTPTQETIGSLSVFAHAAKNKSSL